MLIIYCNIDNPTYDMHLFYTYLLPLGNFAKITIIAPAGFWPRGGIIETPA